MRFVSTSIFFSSVRELVNAAGRLGGGVSSCGLECIKINGNSATKSLQDKTNN